MKNYYLMQLVATGNKLENSKLVTGAKALIADATGVLVGITAGLTGLLIIYNLIRLKAADEHEKPKYKKGWISSLICGIGIILAEGLVALVFSYFM